ncbi:MAG: h [Schlesneria sp.]|nr:h [Schlesneria sp.]
MTLISNQLACLLVLLSNQGPPSGTGAESAETVSALFVQRDQNRDGIWTRSELTTPDDVLAFLAADHNGDFRIPLAEFLVSPAQPSNATWKAFRVTDANRDDSIDRKEFVPADGTPAVVVAAEAEFTRHDRDGNGRLDAAEFLGCGRSILSHDVRFLWMDANEDGRIVLGELAALYPKSQEIHARLEWWFCRREMFADIRLEDWRRRDWKRIRTAADEFWLRDADRDGKLTLIEFAGWEFGVVKPATRQTFGIFDFNQNETLNLAEFRPIPGATPESERTVPDPILIAYETVSDKMMVVLRATSLESWTESTWPTEQLAGVVEPLQLRTATLWDLDKNGTITPDEVRYCLRGAFGLETWTTPPHSLRRAQSLIFNQNYYDSLDQDHDGRMSREEFVKRYHLEPEKGEKEFVAIDANADGFIDLDEVLSGPWFLTNMVSEFTRLDLDLDGRVDPQEFDKQTYTWHQSLKAFVFPAFDQNRDGFLSLMEFRETPAANQLSEWFRAHQDQDGSGTLTFDEFAPPPPGTHPLKLALLRQFMFGRFDRDSDRQLDFQEFPFSVNLAALTAEAAFQYRDKDRNGGVSWEELSTGIAVERRPALRQMFLAFDINENQQLELTEFLALPDVVKPADRIVPDSVRDERDRWLVSMKSLLVASDANRDGQWTTAEWPVSSTLARVLKEPATTSHQVWDFDKDGIITGLELESGADLAFGLIDPLERKYPWHLPDGAVFSGTNWGAFDRNRDGAVTREEFLASYWEKGDAAEKQFQATDRNGDGSISSTEMFTTPWMQPNVVSDFFYFDADRDGRVSREELAARVEPWRKNLGDLAFPAFDKNNDGQLTLTEYRLAQISNPVINWGSAQADQNGDAVLELAEFHPERAQRGVLWLCGITALVFDRFDRNADLRLDADEYTFSVNLAALTAEAAFQYRDKDHSGTISWEELSVGLAAERQPALRQLFVVFDANENRQLELAEFLALPDVVKPVDRIVPDSVRDERDRWLASLTTVFRASDINRDDQWTTAEWPTEAVLLAILREPATLPLAVWDFDKDGTVTAAELGLGADLAFGFIDPLERKFPWRMSNGVVFGGSNWEALDRNRDGAVTREEFLANYWEKGDAAEKQFQATDRDGDGTISAAEMFTTHWMQPYIVGDFLMFDADRDGKVSRNELVSRVEEWRKNLGELAFPAFDKNNDGQLTLAEYRLAQISNPVINWGIAQVDQNADLGLDLSEFFPERTQRGPLWLCGLMATVFDRFDRNSDRRLEPDEFAFSVNVAALTAKTAFQYRDKDRNGGVSLEELSVGQATERQPALRQLFVVFDANENRQLELAEFLALPDVVKPADRIVPDSVRDERDRWLASLTTVLRPADANRDGNWTTAEWPTAALLPLLRNQATVSHQVWDTDKDGNITSAELESGADLAFGLIDPLERKHPWRMPDGSVFQGSNWGALDRNRDGAVTREEFLASYWEKGATAEKQFQATDRDGDGTISAKEMFSAPWMLPNVVSDFLMFDADRNGRVSRDELVSRVEPWRKNLGDLSFPGFDTNGDGQLTLAEYRLTPISNPITNWGAAQTDRNGDGMLDELEFLAERGPSGQLWLCGLAPLVFRRLDTNGDGYLNDTEFEFQGKLPTQLAGSGWGADPVRIACDATVQQFRGWLAVHDRNRDGQLSQNEWPHTEIEQVFPLPVLRAFATWDGNMNGQVSVDEFQNALRGAWGITSRRCPLDWLRRGTGHVVDFNTFTTVDADANGYLSSQEFLERFYGTPAERAKWFPEIDRDHDGSLSLREMLLSGHLLSLPWDTFQKFDSNQDGKLSPMEISANAQSWQKTVAGMCFPTFDDDRDGLLSPAEYRWSPLANPLVNWTRKPADTDKDGTLDIDEFYVRPQGESTAWLTLLAFEYFRRLDKNHNGKLALDEFEFSVDVARLDPVAAFQYADKDHDGGLALADVFLDARPDAKNSSAVINYHRSKMRSEEAFLSADVNKDKLLNQAEYQKYHGYMQDIATPVPRAAGIAPPMATASNRQAPAIPRAQATRSWEDLLMFGLMGFNLLLAVVGGTYWVMKRRAA